MFSKRSETSWRFDFVVAWTFLFAGQAIDGRAANVPPVNDAFALAVYLMGSAILTNGSNVGASREPGEPLHAGNAGGRSVWWRWTAPSTGSVFIHTTGSAFDTLLAVYTGDSVGLLTLVAANDQDLLDPFGGDTSRVKFAAVEGAEYRIAVDGYAGATGSIQLSIEPPPRPANDPFSERAALVGTDVRVVGASVEATREPGEPWHADHEGAHSVWWTWTAPAAGPVEISTLGSDFDTLLAVYSGSIVEDLTAVAANDQDPRGGDTSRVIFQARAGGRYEIAVDGWNGEAGQIQLRLRLSAPPPRLTQPHFADPGHVSVGVTGPAGQAVVLEACADLSAGVWRPIATNAIGAEGLAAFEITPGAARQYFRARWTDSEAR